MFRPHKYLVLTLASLLMAALAVGQTAREERLVFGLQLKPIVPSELFQTGPETFIDGNNTYVNKQRPGYAFGMFMRKSFTKRVALETGINYVVRRWRTSIDLPDESFQDSIDFRIIGYEIPLQGLLFVRLGERIYMNNAFGFSFNMFPSNVASGDQLWGQISARNSWLQLGLLANHGYEFRTENSGTFYLGGTIHRPFSDMYRMRVTYASDSSYEENISRLNGTYVTVDFRYAFHEPAKRKGSLKRKKEKTPLRDYLPW